MARIRTVKPEFWRHPIMARLPDDFQLLALAILTMADDFGYFRAEPELIRGDVQPFRESLARLSEGLEKLSEADWIKIYHHPKQGDIGHVSSWDSHQKVDHPSPSKLKVYYEEASLAKDSRESRETLALEQGTGNREHDTPPKPPKAARGGKVVLGEYPSQMEEAIKAYRTLMKDCKSPEVMNRFPEDKRFIASGIGPNEGIWKAWKNRLGSIVHGSPVTDADILAAIQRTIQARGHDATKGIRLAIPMLPTLINSDYFVDALVKVKEVSNAS